MIIYKGASLGNILNYKIWSANSKDIVDNNSEYYICIPNDNTKYFSLAIVFLDNEQFNNQNHILETINKILSKLKQNNNIMLAFINLEKEYLTDITTSKKQEIYLKTIKYLENVCYDIFEFMISNYEMEQIVYLIVQDQIDKEFATWTISSNNNFKIYDLNKVIEKEAFIIDDTNNGSAGISFTGAPLTNTNNKPKVKILLPPTKHGYSTIYLLSLIIIISLIMGISIAYLMIK